jgi:uncharacterized protein
MIGAYGGSFLTHMVSQRVLLGIFAALMLVTGVRNGPQTLREEGPAAVPLLAVPLDRGSRGRADRLSRCGRRVSDRPSPGAVCGDRNQSRRGIVAGDHRPECGRRSGRPVAAGLAQLVAHAELLGLATRRHVRRLVRRRKVPGESLSKAFGWFVVVLALVIGGLAAAGVRTTSLT